MMETPPTAAPGNTLRAVLDVVYCLDGAQHQKSHGVTPFRTDIDALLKVANGVVTGSRM